jgi:hypothetical protein
MALRNVSLLVLTLLLGSFSGAHTGELDAICALAGNRGASWCITIAVMAG